MAGSGTTITDNSPGAGQITIGVSGSASGAEISYTQITASVNVTATSEAAGTTIISPGAITFNGSPVLVHFFAAWLKTPSGAIDQGITVSLFEGATEIARLATAFTQTTASLRLGPANGFYRFTPTAGAHTYTVTAFVPSTAGTPQVVAGPGGTAANQPAFLRFTYA